MASAETAAHTSIDGYLQSPPLDAEPVLPVEDAAMDGDVSSELAAEAQSDVDDDSHSRPLSGKASISGEEVPRSPHTRVRRNTLPQQQRVLKRVGRILDNPKLTPDKQDERIERLRKRSKLGELMFRTIYLSALQERRIRAVAAARAALVPEDLEDD